MKLYNWQQQDWREFKYSIQNIEDELFIFSEKAGKVSGILNSLPDDVKMSAIVELIVAEAIKTSEIEGEYLSRRDVMSSVQKNLGLQPMAEKTIDKKAQGIGELMIDVRNTFKEPLTEEKLFAWHKMLLPASTSITAGLWRTHEEPMQVVSGALGKQKIHFEAPPSARIPQEMETFLQWFNNTAPGSVDEIKKAPVRSAIAHLYFESVHPFEDGNGRIGRAIAEKALAQGLGRPVVLSLSRTIEAGKKEYYAQLEKAQRSNQITEWVEYFVGVVLDAQTEAEEQIEFTLQKAKFFDRYRKILNERQLKVIRRMLDEGPSGFAGGINARKYVSIAKVSKATATRDLQSLVALGAIRLMEGSGGRSTRYNVNL